MSDANENDDGMAIVYAMADMFHNVDIDRRVLNAFLPPFEGSRQLILRAEQHIRDLQKVVSDLSSKLEIRFEGVEVGGLIKYRVVFSEQCSVQSALIVRDAINNLAICLDVSLCDVARIRKKSIDKVSYPFDEKPRDIKSKLKKMDLGSDFDDFILETHPAVNSENIWASEFHKLDVIMKHRMVVPLVATVSHRMSDQDWASVGASMPPGFSDFVNNNFGFNLIGGPMMMTHGSIVAVKPHIDPTMGFESASSVQLHMPSDVPFAHDNVVDMLVRLKGGIESYIIAIEDKFNKS